MKIESMAKSRNVYAVFIVSLVAAFAFSVLVFLLDPLLSRFPHLADKGPSWYFWKLPAPEIWSRITAWTGYGLHQLAVFIVIFLARREKPHPDSVSPLNVAALAINGLFMLLHLAQTHFFYDGLAQDVPIWTSQYSVIGMLAIFLVLLLPRRGIIWGCKPKLPEAALVFIRKYHSFYIAWALVYTFWFHPMEGDIVIVIGFFYMFMLFLQMSMFNTKFHFSIPWITLNELYVGFHGTAIAIMSGQQIWPMFLFGFLFMFVFTQIHGFKPPQVVKILVLAAFVTGIGIAYWFRGYEKLYELSFIPVTLYGLAFALVFCAWAGVTIARGLRPRK